MHISALNNAELFFKVYIEGYLADKTLEQRQSYTIAEIGSQNVNGSIKDVSPKNIKYIGLDFIEANGVDVILDDPYTLPFADASLDCIVSSSVFEHSEMFWLLFNEIIRVLKPNGLFYLNAPSNGFFHRYPVDCWRFYPDSAKAMVTWAKRCGFNPGVIESYTSQKVKGEYWNDFVAVFVKDIDYATNHTDRIMNYFTDITNGTVIGVADKFVNYSVITQDQIDVTNYWKTLEVKESC
jgi:SAM-dependent methyltransferase